MSSDVWVGAAATLAGVLLGGASSLLLSWLQVKEARRQRREDDQRDLRRRSADRRFQAYADFLTRVRSFRNAAEAYYRRPGHRPPRAELDALLQAANDASALVFLVVESERTYDGCRDTLRALGQARSIIHGTAPGAADEPWAALNALLGRSTRDFQNAARVELGVEGPLTPWDKPELG